jgi:hypothetical protein
MCFKENRFNAMLIYFDAKKSNETPNVHETTGVLVHAVNLDNLFLNQQ